MREFPSTDAEGGGFEPTEALRLQRFSRPPHSTALPPLRGNKDGPLLILAHRRRAEMQQSV